MMRILLALILLSAVAARAGAPSQAAIASAHPLATEAGETILNQGGNAFDAAVAVAAALGVVEPYSSGLGGGGFWMLHRADDGHEVMLDARETAPGRAKRRAHPVRGGEAIDRAAGQGDGVDLADQPAGGERIALARARPAAAHVDRGHARAFSDEDGDAAAYPAVLGLSDPEPGNICYVVTFSGPGHSITLSS